MEDMSFEELCEHFMEGIKKDPYLLEKLKDRIENDNIVE